MILKLLTWVAGEGFGIGQGAHAGKRFGLTKLAADGNAIGANLAVVGFADLGYLAIFTRLARGFGELSTGELYLVHTATLAVGRGIVLILG